MEKNHDFKTLYSGVAPAPGRAAKLVLEDGKVFEGTSFGAYKEVEGEVVFNTGMSGYVETLTDPSYRGQILVLTYPLQGNYGVPKGPFESGKIQVQGLIVSHYSDIPNHHASTESLGEWLTREGIPAIFGIDTRSLTRSLRELGTVPGKLEFSEVAHLDPTVPGPKIEERRYSDSIEMRQVLEQVVSDEIVRYGNGEKKILMIDTGSKENIVRSLLKRDAAVVRAPWNSSWEDVLPDVDGVFLTNGPGDPMDATGLIERIRKLLNADIPIFGICFGHQMLSLAAGAKTYKMKYGHRSVNQPVRDLLTGRCYITSQNHGYVVQNESLPRDWQPWFVNLNDGTNEGIRHLYKPICSVQFHPEASPGPNDTAFLFDDFLRVVHQVSATAKRTNQLNNFKEMVIQ